MFIGQSAVFILLSGLISLFFNVIFKVLILVIILGCFLD